MNADYVPVTIDVLYSYTESINPLPGIYETSYKKGDVINLQFVPKSEYQFQKWTAEPEDSVLFEDPLQPSTNVTILKADSQIVIKAMCEVRPYVVSMTPTLSEEGVPRATVVRIFFSQEMPDNAIYFTEKELSELGIQKKDYQENTAGKDKNGNQLYYAYKKNGENIYKNIQIKRRGTDFSLLNNFEKPYFEAYDRTALVIVPNRYSPPSAYSEVEVTIESDIFNSNGISMKTPYSNFYMTNAERGEDNAAPQVINIKKICANGINPTDGTLKYINITDAADEITINFTGTVMDFGSTNTSYVEKIYIGLVSNTKYDQQSNWDEIKWNENNNLVLMWDGGRFTYVVPGAGALKPKKVDLTDEPFTFSPNKGTYYINIWAEDANGNVGVPLDIHYAIVYNPK